MSTISLTFGTEDDNVAHSFNGLNREEDLILQMGGGNDYVHASSGTNTIYLGKGNDTFDSVNRTAGPFQDDTVSGASEVYAGDGNDVLYFEDSEGVAYGGKDNDTYYIRGDSHDVAVIELANEGIDTVNIDVWNGDTYYVPTNVENLNVGRIYYWGASYNPSEMTNNQFELGFVDDGAKIVGNELANRITGSDMKDTLHGGDGADTQKGGLADDVLHGENGNDVLWGEHGHDSVYGGAGDDKLEGHDGNDRMDGGADNDAVWGGGGNDQMWGSGGNDTMVGGAGADTMSGGANDDTYSNVEAGDLIVEGAGAGSDTVTTRLGSYTLSANLEHLTYLGTASFTGTGNAQGNVMKGGEQADVLKGMGGNDALTGNGGNDLLEAGAGDDYAGGGNGMDTIHGGTGNDKLFGQNDADYITGGDGDDQVDGGAGNDNLHGNGGADLMSGGDGNDLLQGGDGNDDIRGGAGDDVIYGGLGRDKLYGDAGRDSFRYQSLSESNAVSGRDFLYGFEQGQDKIDLSWIDANSTVAGNQAFAFTGPGAFFQSAGDLWVSTNLLGTNVNMDVNGDGMADMSLTVVGVWTMTANDFVL